MTIPLFLSTNLTHAKFTLGRLDLPESLLPNAINTAENLFEHVFKHYPKISITSGYRSPATNKASKGRNASQHLTAEALDIVFLDTTPRAALKHLIASGLVFDQAIIEDIGRNKDGIWLHLSLSNTRKKQRMQVMTAERLDPNDRGSMIYKDVTKEFIILG